jgi:short-subunit dehydrogenase
MNKIVIFGATSAIAQAVARRYAATGASLFLVGRSAERLEAIAADLRVRGADAVTLAAVDLADLPRHAALVAQADAALGGLDAALIAHGTLPDQRTCEDDTALALSHIGINYLSPVSLMTELAKTLRARRSGVIAVIGSVAGDRGRQSNYLYGSAKGGLAVFAEGLRHRMEAFGVRVVLVKPGFVDTPMTAAIDKGGPLWATPDKVAGDIVAAMDKGNATIYTPWFWRGILAIIRNVPYAIFRKTQL